MAIKVQIREEKKNNLKKKKQGKKQEKKKIKYTGKESTKYTEYTGIKFKCLVGALCIRKKIGSTQKEMSQTYSSQDLRNRSMLIGHGIVLGCGLTSLSG